MEKPSELEQAKAELALMRMTLTEIARAEAFKQLPHGLADQVNQILRCPDVGRETLAFWTTLAAENLRLREQLLRKEAQLHVQEGH